MVIEQRIWQSINLYLVFQREANNKNFWRFSWKLLCWHAELCTYLLHLNLYFWHLSGFINWIGITLLDLDLISSYILDKLIIVALCLFRQTIKVSILIEYTNVVNASGRCLTTRWSKSSNFGLDQIRERVSKDQSSKLLDLIHLISDTALHQRSQFLYPISTNS